MHDGHPAPSCTPGDVGDVLDESDPGTGRGQLGQARIGPDHAPLHLLDEERAMARRHEMGQAICLRPRGIGEHSPHGPHGPFATPDSPRPAGPTASDHGDPTGHAVRVHHLATLSFRPGRGVAAGRVRQYSVCTIFDS